MTERGKILNPDYNINRDQPTSRASPLRINVLLSGETQLWFSIRVIIDPLSVIEIQLLVPRAIAMILISIPRTQHVVVLASASKSFDVLRTSVEYWRKHIKLIFHRLKFGPSWASTVLVDEVVDGRDYGFKVSSLLIVKLSGTVPGSGIQRENRSEDHCDN